MLDFLMISMRPAKNGKVEIYPKFIAKKSSDLMIRGGGFYAIWDEERGLWATDEYEAVCIIDKELERYFKKYKPEHKDINDVRVLYLWDTENGMIDKWHNYCKKQLADNYQMLDEKLVFSNDGVNKKDYASKRLTYPLEMGNISAYNELMSTLYSLEERQKIEWAIGSIVTGDSKKIQKFLVLYGSAGTGKSTVLNIIEQLFEGYSTTFEAKAIGSANSVFALESFKTNPLVAIQHDGDLSKIEDNTRLNSLVSHELMTVNEKFKSTYSNRFKCFLFMGTNKPVKITDAKSGLIRRLIDVSPTGNKLNASDYNRLVKQVSFELGAIAYHCKEVYLSNPNAYDDYIPISMMGASNHFYNFVEESFPIFKKDDGVTLRAAWEMYKTYCDESKVAFMCNKMVFKEELKNYFWEFENRFTLNNGKRVRNYYKGFRTEKIDGMIEEKNDANSEDFNLIDFKEQSSIFDKEYASCAAQYATSNGTPFKKWEKVTTKLSEIDTKLLHYVKVTNHHHIVADFDLTDANGNKSFELNLKEASKWPATYAELSKSGEGIHLHYIYDGDVSKLSRVYDDKIEIKVFTGNSSLRRKLTKCNNLPITTINSGLPLKGETKMINFDAVKSEKGLRTLIKRNLNKEIHPATKPSIDFIYKILEDAHDSNLRYDVTDMRNSVLAFGASSTHQAEYCIKLVNNMKFKSEEPSEMVTNDKVDIVFYDVEVFPNLFLVNWKLQGPDNPVLRMINPKPSEIEELLKFRLIGFNNRGYDNHMLYACLMGYTNEQLYRLSGRLISKDRKIKMNAKFGEAYNLSYTDVYDFAATKQSLKKWEIELGIHHQELGLPWDQPVDESLWTKVAEYCDNDVLATEAVFDHLKGDFLAREILADLAGGTVNDTTNTLTTKIIFGNNKHPQDQFNYRDLGEVSNSDIIPSGFDDFTRFNGKSISDDLPYGQPVFPGYEYSFGKSTYRGEIIGEGGRVYAEPGIYGNVPVLDIVSQHPHSIIMEKLFGDKYTDTFADLVEGRVDIKHEAWEELNNVLDGKLTPYIQLVLDGKLTSSDLAYALKIAINSVYGLTAAKFDNPFKDPRNADNIVAKRGALFMENLKHEVQKRGFIVAHIKTDSIKIPDATPEIIKFVMDYGKMYGYTFEHEATYERMCLVNDAVYIAKYKTAEECKDMYNYIPEKNYKYSGKWSATGAQFAVPYVFKKLFSKEDITFNDMCETKSVKEGVMYLDMDETLSNVSIYEKELDTRKWNESHLDKKPRKLNPELSGYSNAELAELISSGHNYIFVGRVGCFVPVKPNCGGGVLYRKKDDKYYAVTGTKNYRWKESEIIKELGLEGDIDRSYYDHLVDEAISAISFWGDAEWFISNDPYISPEYKNGKPVYLDFGVNEGDTLNA